MPRRKASVPATDVEQGADATPAEAEEVSTVETVVVPTAEEVAEAGAREDGDVYPPSGVAPGAEIPRSAALKALVSGNAPDVAGEPPTPGIAPRLSGRRQEWDDGDAELVEAVVTASMFKAVQGLKVRFGYRGDVIAAPAELVEKGVRMGALVRKD